MVTRQCGTETQRESRLSSILSNQKLLLNVLLLKYRINTGMKMQFRFGCGVGSGVETRVHHHPIKSWRRHDTYLVYVEEPIKAC